MNADFNFNIDNYDLDEIKHILGVPSKYDIAIINNCYEQKLSKLYANKLADNNIIHFMGNIKEKLIDNYNSSIQYTSTFNTTSHSVITKNTENIENVVKSNGRLNAIEVYPTSIGRSNLNNLKRKTKLVTLMFNSTFINNDNDTDTILKAEYIFTLPIMFKNVFSMKLSSLQLPLTIYSFSEYNKNNKFYIKENNTNKQGSIVIADGNYTSNEIVIYLTILINTTLVTDDRFIVTINTNNGKITIFNSTNTFTISFEKQNVNDTNNDNYNCGLLLGFIKPKYINSDTYTGETLYNPTKNNYLYFCLDDFNKSQYNSIIGILKDSLIDTNILALVPITVDYFNYNFNNGSDYIQKTREYFGPINLVKIAVKLKNSLGNIINLQGQPFSFSLELETAYDW